MDSSLRAGVAMVQTLVLNLNLGPRALLLSVTSLPPFHSWPVKLLLLPFPLLTGPSLSQDTEPFSRLGL